MPKFQVTVTRQPAKPEVLEVSADSADEACWLALSRSGAWKDAEARAVCLESPPADAGGKAMLLPTAA